MSDFSTCPSCGHLHPGGVGLSLCLCGDCYLWFGSIPRVSLSEKAAARLKELVAMKSGTLRGETP